ncbi:MAG: C-type lectin domain-containing protein [Rubripirellula sp.]
MRKRIPGGAVSFGGHKYFYHDPPATYRVALEIAESVGGHLVRTDSLKEFDFLMRMTGGRGMIDGTCERGDGKWRFANGEELKLGNIRFRTREPSGGPLEFVLVLTANGINDQVYSRYAFIIEWDD